MSLQEIWGAPTWRILHTLVENINNNEFELLKYEAFSIIKNLCILLPCIASITTSKLYFQKVKLFTFTNVNDLKNMLFMFHNFTNARTRKPLFKYSDISIYQNIDIILAYNDFVNAYANPLMKTTINYSKIQLVIADLDNFIKKYIRKPVIVEPILLVIEEPIISLVVEEPIVEEPIVEEPIVEEPIVEKPIVEEPIVEEEEEEESTEQVVLKTLTDIVKKIEYDAYNSNMYEKIDIISKSGLPPIEMGLAEAMLVMINDPKCQPFPQYLELWKFYKAKYNKKHKINTVDNSPIIIDAILPTLDFTLPIAINAIKNNPKCVPFEAYVKRWNQLKSARKLKIMTTRKI